MVKKIIVIDDRSTDGTVQQIEGFNGIYPTPILLLRRNIKTWTLNAQIIGSKYASSDYILVLDCDLQHSALFILNFIRQIRDNIDVVVGSRYAKGGFNDWSAYRRV